MILTVPQLLAAACQFTDESTSGRCLFCGAPAVSDYVLSKSFSAIETLAAPGSNRICRGCLLMLEESGEATYSDRSSQTFTKGYRRCLSHVITPTKVVQGTKGHTEWLRGVCLKPPKPPYAISIAVSGQKHILYRGRVCIDERIVTVSLEGEIIEYEPTDLRERLELCGRLVAATGKPALAEPVTANFAMRVCERFADGERMVMEWSEIRETPISRLAAFLSMSKEKADAEYPGDRRESVPIATGGPARPEREADRPSRAAKREARSHPTLFDDV